MDRQVTIWILAFYEEKIQKSSSIQDLHQHTARAHCDKRRLREKDASPEVSYNSTKKDPRAPCDFFRKISEW